MNYLKELQLAKKNREAREFEDLKIKELITQINEKRNEFSSKFINDLEEFLKNYK